MIKNQEKKKNHYLRIGIALILLCNPNVNLVDILPDFIAYFLLFFVISEAADLAPHFAQAREAAKKLAILCVFKIPASSLTIVARSHNTMDSNLIPTFAIIFALFEMILGYTFIYHASEGLFYLGERTDASALIAPFQIRRSFEQEEAKPMGKRSFFRRKHQPEVLRSLSLVFLFTKCFSSFIPELLLLTRKQEYIGDTTGQSALLRLYPLALTLAFLLTLAVGIYWFLLARAYLKAIQKEKKFSSALLSLAGEELIEKKQRHELCNSYLFGFTLIAIASLFSLNFMPIFGFALFLLLASCWIRTKKGLRIALRTIGAVSFLSSTALSLLIDAFEYDYGYKSLLKNEDAIAAYAPCITLAIVNTMLLLFFITLIYFAIRQSIFSNLGLSPKNSRYGKNERKYHGSLCRLNFALYILSALSVLSRGIYVYLKGQVTLITGEMNAFTTLSHKWEFWPLVMTIIAIPYIIYAFYYMGIMKEEMKLALDAE